MHISVSTSVGIRTFNPDLIASVLYDMQYITVDIILSDGLTYKLTKDAALEFWEKYKKITV